MGKVIKPGKWNERNDAVDSFRSEIRERIGDKNLPKEIRLELKAIAAKMEEIKPAKADGLRKLSGKVLSMDEVKEISEDATGYKWKIAEWTKKSSPFDESPRETLEMLVERFGIAVNNKAAAYILTRNTNDRSELSTLEVICLPGHVFVEWDSDRVSGSSDRILPNEKFKTYLRKQ